MLGRMMQFPLTINALVRHAAVTHAGRPISSRRADRTIERYTFGECITRARQLGNALRTLGLRDGDRIATLAWTNRRHLELYYGAPSFGLVLHTLNIRLHPDELAYICGHADDRAIVVDKSLWPVFEKFADRHHFDHVIVASDHDDVPGGTISFDDLVASGRDDEPPDINDENTAAALCYTSGTTGKPKGVMYSHRSQVLHALVTNSADVINIGSRDITLPIVPMFHVNAWGIPYGAALAGSGLALPSQCLDPLSIVELMASEHVTVAAGVPTIWMGVLDYLDQHRGEHDLSHVKQLTVGGSAVPESLICAFSERHGLEIRQGWGMTELSPVGSFTSPREGHGQDYAYRATAGAKLPFVEIRARNVDGLVPWDGQTMGELEVRGPFVVGEYYESEPDEGGPRFTDDGWFRTGDIVTIGKGAHIVIQDRSKDLIKSGGEWISSVQIESHLVAHESVADAAVIAIAHPRWMERPLALVVLRPGHDLDQDALQRHIASRFAKWWIPDAFVRVETLPRTATGKIRKNELRAQFSTHVAAVPV